MKETTLNKNGIKVQIINNFDIDDIRKNIKELLPNILIETGENDKTDFIKNGIALIIGILCLFSGILFGVFTGETMNEKVLKAILSCSLFFIIGFFLFIGFICPLVNRKMSIYGRQKAMELLDSASELKDFVKVLEHIYMNFYGFVSSEFLYDIYDLRIMRNSIKNYLSIMDKKVLAINYHVNHLTIDICEEDGNVINKDIYCEHKENINVTGPVLTFSNWDNPVYITPYRNLSRSNFHE